MNQRPTLDFKLGNIILWGRYQTLSKAEHPAFKDRVFSKRMQWLLPLLMLLMGCGTQREMVQHAPTCYLRFVGHLEGAVAQVNDSAPFKLYRVSCKRADDKGFLSSSCDYAQSPGRCHIVIRREGKIITERDLLLSNGVTREVEVP